MPRTFLDLSFHVFELVLGTIHPRSSLMGRVYSVHEQTTANRSTHERTTVMTTMKAKPAPTEIELSQPRDTDELEGALLPPTAAPVDESKEFAAAAVPVTAFVYGDSEYINDEVMLTAEADLPTAPFLPRYQSVSMKQQRERSAIAKGKRRGVIQAESEKEAVGKASRESYAKDWHARQQVEAANAEARRRNKDGVQVVEDRYTVERKDATPFSEEQEPAFATSYKGGYEVQEYDVSEYKGADGYEVSVYKSVYDP